MNLSYGKKTFIFYYLNEFLFRSFSKNFYYAA